MASSAATSCHFILLFCFDPPTHIHTRTFADSLILQRTLVRTHVHTLTHSRALQGDYVKGLNDEEQAKLGDPAGADVELAVGMKVYVKWPGSSEEGGSDDVFRAMVVAHKPPKTRVEDAGACETLHILRPW